MNSDAVAARVAAWIALLAAVAAVVALFCWSSKTC